MSRRHPDGGAGGRGRGREGRGAEGGSHVVLEIISGDLQIISGDLQIISGDFIEEEILKERSLRNIVGYESDL